MCANDNIVKLIEIYTERNEDDIKNFRCFSDKIYKINNNGERKKCILFITFYNLLLFNPELNM